MKYFLLTFLVAIFPVVSLADSSDLPNPNPRLVSKRSNVDELIGDGSSINPAKPSESEPIDQKTTHKIFTAIKSNTTQNSTVHPSTVPPTTSAPPTKLSSTTVPTTAKTSAIPSTTSTRSSTTSTRSSTTSTPSSTTSTPSSTTSTPSSTTSTPSSTTSSTSTISSTSTTSSSASPSTSPFSPSSPSPCPPAVETTNNGWMIVGIIFIILAIVEAIPLGYIGFRYYKGRVVGNEDGLLINS